MIVDDYMNVYGRGWLIIAYGDELSSMSVHCGDRIVSDGITFTIEGIEKIKYDEGWWMNRMGFVLSPNNIVPDHFEIGQEIEIIQNKEQL